MESDHQAKKRVHPKSKFSTEEDALLTQLVSQYGENDFDRIAKYMPNRNSRQCKDRWINYLSPAVCRTPWSEEEDAQLYQLFNTLGPKWVKIAKELGRTDTNVKNRYLVLERHKAKAERKRLGIKSHHKKRIPVIEPVTNEYVPKEEMFSAPLIFESSYVEDLNSWDTQESLYTYDTFENFTF